MWVNKTQAKDKISAHWTQHCTFSFWLQAFRIPCSLTSSRYSWLCSPRLPLLDLSMGHLSHSDIYIIKLGLFTLFFSLSCKWFKRSNRHNWRRETVGNGRTYIYWKKNPHINTPMQFKRILFRGHLYTEIGFWRWLQENENVIFWDEPGNLIKKLFLASYPL